MPNSANEIQVGGTHYKATTYQHWDFAADCRLGYFEGQVTKYISRHHKKNGLQDVEKAGHFIDKMLELYRTTALRPMNSAATFEKMTRFCAANALPLRETQVVKWVAGWVHEDQLNAARSAVNLLIEDYRVRAESEGGDPA